MRTLIIDLGNSFTKCFIRSEKARTAKHKAMRTLTETGMPQIECSVEWRD